MMARGPLMIYTHSIQVHLVHQNSVHLISGTHGVSPRPFTPHEPWVSSRKVESTILSARCE